MKRNTGRIPIVCTLLLLGLGLQMPRLAAAAFDHRLAGEITPMENAGVSLTLAQETDFFQTLALFAEAPTQIVLQEGYHMTAETAQDAAVNIMAALGNADAAKVSPEVMPLLLSSKSTLGLTGVFWRCEWNGKDGYQEALWLDDQSGEMVSARYRALPRTSVSGSAAAVSTDEIQMAAVRMLEYCREHYPVSAVGLAAAETSAQTAGDGSGESYLMTLVRERDGETETFCLSLDLYENWLYFSP